MSEMFRWLLQWLNKLLNYPFGSRQTQELDSTSGSIVEGSLPELTNVDMEVLFNELLEGVHQARGQQWAVKYLERMRPRITVNRWIDWLLVFGQKLLSSPAPNTQIATRMVKLGELKIGQVGELASEIGIQLLNRDLLAQNLQQNLPTTLQSGIVTVTQPTEPFLSSPEQQLSWDFGEQLLDYRQEEQQETVNIPQASTSAENPPAEVSESAIYEFTRKDQENLGSFEETVEEIVGYSAIEYLDQSLANLEPKVAQTLDELVVRLEQSTNLVQQLVLELALRDAYSGQTRNQEITQQSSFQLTQPNQAQQWFYQGLEQARSGDLLGAMAFYGQAIKLQPDACEYWFNQGLALFHLGCFEEAIAAYDQAISLNPDFAKAWYNRGRVLGELGDFDAAVASFDQAIKFKSEYQEAWASRGLALLKLGLIWEAIFSYEQALTLQNQDEQTWYYRGIALGIVEQFEEAIASYDQALDIQPDYHEVWIDRGLVLFKLKRWSEAIASWDQALSIQSDLYLAWYNRGIALENLGKREESIESYQQAINIKHDFHLAWYNQAVALFYLGRFVESISCYDSALEIKLDYWEAWLGRALAVSKVDDNNEPSLSLSTNLARSNPALNRRDYEGKLATYQEGLKYLRPDTHPEGWGRLHLAIGNTHYEHGKKQPSPRDYWQEAVYEYKQALLTLTSADFTELHLEVLQALTKVFVALGETSPAQKLQRQGLNILQKLLNDITRPEQNKQQLALKFVPLRQLGVDLAVNVGDLVEAWEIAEHCKNLCLQLQISGWSDEITSPNYQSIQKLLNPQTAVIYWHISPAALHTFIIKHEAPSPILLFTPIQYKKSILEEVNRLVEFEIWLEFWQNKYQEHCQNQDLDNHHKNSWFVDMEGRLLNLQHILNIPTIIEELEGITNITLIPHEDLQKLPLHQLFTLQKKDEHYTINYLPTVQIGLELNTLKTLKILKKNNLSNWQQQKFLSLEDETKYIKPAVFAAAVVRNMFPNSEHIQSSQVTQEQLKNALSADYNILHFAGNTLKNSNEVTQSTLISGDKGQLTSPKITQKRVVNCNLFIFTNCGHLIDNIQKISSEHVGLKTELLCGGIPYVLSTLWDVESPASALVIIEFYRRLLVHESPGNALAEATTWLKEITVAQLIRWYEDLLTSLSADEIELNNYIKIELDKNRKLSSHIRLYSHPYYWAAFILSGCS